MQIRPGCFPKSREDLSNRRHHTLFTKHISRHRGVSVFTDDHRRQIYWFMYSGTVLMMNGWLIIGLTISVIFISCENTLNIDIVEIKNNFVVRNGSSNFCATDTLSILLVVQLSKIHEWNLSICLVERVRNRFSIIFT